MSIKLTLTSDQITMILISLRLNGQNLHAQAAQFKAAEPDSKSDFAKLGDDYIGLAVLISELAIQQDTPPWHV